VTSAIERARSVLGFFAVETVTKGIWGSPAGKTHLARRIVAEIPEHRVYVEPFAGGAQVLFAKEPSEVEVVSDLDPEIAFAFKFAKNVTPEQLERLRRMKWVGDKAHFRKLYESSPPSDDVGRFYRFAYLIRFSFNKLRRGTMPDKNVGAQARFVEKLERHAPRLKDVRVRNSDYEKVIEEYDGPDAFFFLDPPYAGHDADCRVGAGHRDWDEERFGGAARQQLCVRLSQAFGGGAEVAPGGRDQTTDDAGGQLLELCVRGSRQPDEAKGRFRAGARNEQAVRDQAVEVGIEQQGTREAMHEGHGARLAIDHAPPTAAQTLPGEQRPQEGTEAHDETLHYRYQPFQVSDVERPLNRHCPIT